MTGGVERYLLGRNLQQDSAVSLWVVSWLLIRARPNGSCLLVSFISLLRKIVGLPNEDARHPAKFEFQISMLFCNIWNTLILTFYYVSDIQILFSILYLFWPPFVQWEFSTGQPRTEGILVGNSLLSSCGRHYLCKLCYLMGHNLTSSNQVWLSPSLDMGGVGCVGCCSKFLFFSILSLSLRYNTCSLPWLFLYCFRVVFCLIVNHH